jgi:DHA3 family tetracycline resistance protein-like MFS transporter
MRGWFTTSRLYMLLQLTNAFTLYLWLTIQPIYHIQTAGLTAFQLVLVGIVLEGTVLIFETPTGIIADTYSRQLSIIIAMFISGCGLLIEGLYSSFGLILLGNMIWGFGWTFLSGANEAWVVDELGTEVGNAAILRASQWSPVASLCGIATSVALSKIGFTAPIILAGVISLGLGILLIPLMQEKNFTPTDNPSNPLAAMRGTLNTGIAALRLRPILLLIMLVGGMRGLWVGGFERLWPAFLIEQYTFTNMGIEVWMGIIRAAILALSIFSIGTARKRLNLKSSAVAANTLQWLYCVIIVTSLGFALVNQWWLTVTLFLINQTALATCRPIFIAWINQHAESRVRATMISMYWQSVSLASVTGGLFVGGIATIRTLQQALIAASLAMTPALPLFRQSRKHEQS